MVEMGKAEDDDIQPPRGMIWDWRPRSVAEI